VASQFFRKKGWGQFFEVILISPSFPTTKISVKIALRNPINMGYGNDTGR